MDRKSFIKKSSTVLGISLLSPFGFSMVSENRKHLSRIGLTTVCFRHRLRDEKSKEIKNELLLEEVPKYFSDRFGIGNIEIWSNHILCKDQSYLDRLKKELKKNKCTLINIQADTKNDVSNPDQKVRERGIAEMKEWINVAVYLGSKMVRVSSMNGSIDEAIKSIRLLNQYALEKRIILLVENHNDLFSDTKKHVRIAREIKCKNSGLITDFGNYSDEVDRYKAIEEIAPFTKLVSAKTMDFNSNYNHSSYDFGKCIRIMENAGYKGIYSLEQWSTKGKYDIDLVVDWMIEQVLENV